MRLIDMQVSVNGTAPGGHQFARAHALYTYRFLHEIDQARKTNLHRQESALPAGATVQTMQIQDGVPVRPMRIFTNRVKRSEETEECENGLKEPGNYEKMSYSSGNQTVPIEIDFLA